MNPALLLHVAQALGLGLGVAGLLWLLRGFKPVRRVEASLLLTAIIGGIYLIVNDSGWPAELILKQFLVAAMVMLAGNAGVQLFDVFLWDYILGQRRHVAVPRLIVDVFNFVALALVALGVLNRVFGVELSAFLVTSTVLSAVIGLALQDMLSSIIAGLALQLERPLGVGDWVRLGQQEGVVTQMNWRSVTLRTRDNQHYFLPNATVAKQEIINFSRPSPLQRLRVTVGLAYRHPPGQVKEVLIRTALDITGVQTTPAPQVFVISYGDFAIQYELLFWIVNYLQAETIRDAVMTRLWYELRRAQLTIPFPIRDVNVRTVPEDYEARAEEQQRHEMLAVLRHVPLFAPLNDAQIEQLVRGAVLQRYTAGEALVRQGDEGDSLFVIKSGQVRVDLNMENGPAITVAHRGPDEFFGEASLLTGEPRSASVIATTETEVVEVDKPDLAAIIAQDASVLEALTTALETRMREASDDRATATGPLKDKGVSQHAALLGRIRRFFGIKA